WTIPELDSRPIASLGLAVRGGEGATVLVDSIDWKGAPSTTFSTPGNGNTMWRRAWVDGVQAWSSHWNTNPFTVSQNEGTGLISQGTEDWTDYEVSADVTIPLGASAGLAARIGGMRRYLALV